MSRTQDEEAKISGFDLRRLIRRARMQRHRGTAGRTPRA
jgi:hypothetical protein